MHLHPSLFAQDTLYDASPLCRAYVKIWTAPIYIFRSAPESGSSWPKCTQQGRLGGKTGCSDGFRYRVRRGKFGGRRPCHLGAPEEFRLNARSPTRGREKHAKKPFRATSVGGTQPPFFSLRTPIRCRTASMTEPRHTRMSRRRFLLNEPDRVVLKATSSSAATQPAPLWPWSLSQAIVSVRVLDSPGSFR